MKLTGFHLAVVASLALHAGAIAVLSQKQDVEIQKQQLVMPEQIEVSLMEEAPVQEVAKAEPEKPKEVKKKEKKIEEAAKLEPAAAPVEKQEETKPVEVASVEPPAAAKPVAQTEPLFNAAYLNNPAPEYPAAAKRRGIEGTVILGVQVTANGRAAHITIHKTSGSDLLDFSALEAVSKWEFVPARAGDQNVESNVRVPITFSLN